MKKRLIVAAIVLVGASGVAALALHSSLSGEVTNDPGLVKRGEYLALAGDCAAWPSLAIAQPVTRSPTASSMPVAWRCRFRW